MKDAVDQGAFEQLSLSACFALYSDYFALQGIGRILAKNQSAQVPAAVGYPIIHATCPYPPRLHSNTGPPPDAENSPLCSCVSLIGLVAVMLIFGNAMLGTFLVPYEFSVMCDGDQQPGHRCRVPCAPGRPGARLLAGPCRYRTELLR